LNRILSSAHQRRKVRVGNNAETIIDLFHLKEVEQRGAVLERFMRKFSKQVNQPAFCKLLAEEMLRTHQYRNSQRYGLHLDLQFGKRLLSEWCSKVNEHEVPMIYSRFALLY